MLTDVGVCSGKYFFQIFTGPFPSCEHLQTWPSEMWILWSVWNHCHEGSKRISFLTPYLMILGEQIVETPTKGRRSKCMLASSSMLVGQGVLPPLVSPRNMVKQLHELTLSLPMLHDRYCSYWPWSWMWTTSLGQMHIRFTTTTFSTGTHKKEPWTITDGPTQICSSWSMGKETVRFKGYTIAYTIYFLHSLYFSGGRPLSHVFNGPAFKSKTQHQLLEESSPGLLIFGMPGRAGFGFTSTSICDSMQLCTFNFSSVIKYAILYWKVGESLTLFA